MVTLLLTDTEGIFSFSFSQKKIIKYQFVLAIRNYAYKFSFNNGSPEIRKHSRLWSVAISGR